MAVSYTKIHQDSTTIPSFAGSTQFSVANTIPSGLVESFIIQWKGTGGAIGITASTLTTAVNSLRIVFNGDQWFNFNTTVNQVAVAVGSRIGSMLDDVGGYVAENQSLTDVDCSMVIPCGINLPPNSRFEIDMNYFALAAAGNTFVGNFSVWVKYGNSLNASIYGNATSFPVSANSQTLMTVAIPSYKGAKVSGIVLQGANGNDELTSVVIQDLGLFAMSPTYLRGASGASQNGYLYTDMALDAKGLIPSDKTSGYYFIPLYDLDAKSGSVNLLLTSSVAQTYTATPILKLSTGGSGENVGTQTASKATGSSQAILRRAEE
jgi:hypothetical protein